jgi:hypothetical protein
MCVSSRFHEPRDLRRSDILLGLRKFPAEYSHEVREFASLRERFGIEKERHVPISLERARQKVLLS